MERPPEQVLQFMIEREAAADKVLDDKQHLVNFDIRRQKIREAIRAVQKDKSSEKTLMCFNNLFIELPKERVEKLLQRDSIDVEAEIRRVSDGLKPLVNRLRDIEYKEDAPGFHLNPLSEEDKIKIRGKNPLLENDMDKLRDIIHRVDNM